MSDAGVYAIVHLASGKRYVGSSVNIRRRRASHFRELRSGSHSNRHLQAAWNKYGEDAFAFFVLDHCGRGATVRREQAWIDALRPFGDRGYNLSPTAGNVLGLKFTDEQRAHVSAGLKGKPKSAEHRANIWGSRKVTPEMREQMAANGRKSAGRPKSPEHRARIGVAQQGDANHWSKLTTGDVVAIRERLASGERGRHLAAEFGVHESVISQIKNGRVWRHIPSPQLSV